MNEKKFFYFLSLRAIAQFLAFKIFSSLFFCTFRKSISPINILFDNTFLRLTSVFPFVPSWQQNKIGGNATTLEELIKLEKCKVIEVEDASNMTVINHLIEMERKVLKSEDEINRLIEQKAYQS